MVIEAQIIWEAMKRTPDDDELVMMQMGIESEASVIKVELLDIELFESKYRHGAAGEPVSIR